MTHVVTDPLLAAAYNKGSHKVDKVGGCPKCHTCISFKVNTISVICRCGKYLHKEDLVDEIIFKELPTVLKGYSAFYVEDPNHGIMTRKHAERHYMAEEARGKKLGSGHSKPKKQVVK
jgi:hypothetical protein